MKRRFNRNSKFWKLSRNRKEWNHHQIKEHMGCIYRVNTPIKANGGYLIPYTSSILSQSPNDWSGNTPRKRKKPNLSAAFLGYYHMIMRGWGGELTPRGTVRVPSTSKRAIMRGLEGGMTNNNEEDKQVTGELAKEKSEGRRDKYESVL